jgi:hypothetical protein
LGYGMDKKQRAGVRGFGKKLEEMRNEKVDD